MFKFDGEMLNSKSSYLQRGGFIQSESQRHNKEFIAENFRDKISRKVKDKLGKAQIKLKCSFNIIKMCCIKLLNIQRKLGQIQMKLNWGLLNLWFVVY